MNKTLLIFAECEYRGHHSVPESEVKAFSEGYDAGAHLFGSPPMLRIYVWPEDRDLMREEEDSDEVEEALTKASLV